ncbi:putative long-chain-fatty-acid--CoA ligase [Rosa chinensis]|uniref:Putative long-chain-fatty-acid--CoA ligase n=1 Tax=Rosa chinensis TaxID=74649 RepID=A0A2P6PNP8_ROSCH|nr:putative long-chain-fatty-acid--CoA ligase [Rosa chinensis]
MAQIQTPPPRGWIIAMEACNSHAITYVPLYDTLGANAVEFIINHAEVPIAFVQENKIPAHSKKEAEELGVSCVSWEEFFQLGNSDYELPLKQRTAVCTIMCRSGTTREPKGLIVTNAALMSEVLSTDHILFLKDRMINKFTQLTSSIF